MVRFLLVILAVGLFMGCEEVPPEDTEEQLCTATSGQWNLSTVTCDGVAQTVDPASIVIDHNASTVVYSQGEADCVASTTYSSAFDFSSEVSLTGTGNLSCSQNGSSVNSCTGTNVSCNITTSVSSLQNDYSQCLVANETRLSLSRTVTAQQVSSSVTFCTEGQTETLNFVLPSAGSAAVLAISDGPNHDYGNVNVSSSSQKTFTVTNSGTGDASALVGSGLSAPFSFTGGSYPGTGGTCGASLAASATCTLVVSFSPTSAGTFADNIDLSYNDGSSSQSVSRSIQGTGVAGGGGTAILVISESDPYNYGTLAIGSTSNHSFTVTNTGSATASALSGSGLAAPFGFLGGTYPGTGGTCGASLAAAATCTLVVSFSPTATGVSTDTINLDYNDGSANQTTTRDVQGTATVPANLVISDGPVFDYGNVNTGNNSNRIFTVTNTGGFTATALSASGLAAPFGFTGAAYPGSGGTCGFSLAPAASCTIDVQFSPSVLGLATDTINLDYNNGVSAQTATRDLQGTGQ